MELQPQVGLLYQTLMVEEHGTLVEYLVGRTERNMSQHHSVHHKYHMHFPAIESGHSC